MATDVAWIGPYPAHYSRKFHRALEGRWPGKFHFVYVVRRDRGAGRSYEVGGIAESSTVIQERSAPGEIWMTIRVLEELDPSALIVSGHSPLGLVTAALWGLAHGRNIAYRSDTNLVELFRHRSAVRRGFHLLLGRTLLRSMDVLVYIGSQNRSYYRWATGRCESEQRYVGLPIPHDLSFPSGGTRNYGPWNRGSDPTLTFLYLGRLAPEKSVQSLIRAGSLLDDGSRAWRLVIAGDGAEREALERLTANEELRDSVSFLGEVSSDTRADVYGSADVFVLPSNREAWGLVVNEALAASLPVVAPYWVGAVADLVIDGFNGVVLDSNAPEELAKGMSVVLNDSGRAKEMGRRGPEIISSGGWNLKGALGQMDELLDLLG